MTTREEMLDAGERAWHRKYMKVYQHIKRGYVYRILHMDVLRERDLVRMVVYQRVSGDRTIWVRPSAEFFDPTRFRVCEENTELDSRMPSAHDEDRTEF